MWSSGERGLGYVLPPPRRITRTTTRPALGISGLQAMPLLNHSSDESNLIYANPPGPRFPHLYVRLKPGSLLSWKSCSRNPRLLPGASQKVGGAGLRSEIWARRRGAAPPSPKGIREKAGPSPCAAESRFFPTEMETLDPHQHSQDASFASQAASGQAVAGPPWSLSFYPWVSPSFHSSCLFSLLLPSPASPTGEKKHSVL